MSLSLGPLARKVENLDFVFRLLGSTKLGISYIFGKFWDAKGKTKFEILNKTRTKNDQNLPIF
jgi:hypothetical protein